MPLTVDLGGVGGAMRVQRASIPQPLGVAGEWSLVFEDHFVGTANAAPDLTKWNYWLPDEERRDATNRAANTYLDGSSNLVIRTQMEGALVTCGGLRSIAHYGPETYFEFRAAMPGTQNQRAWSALWHTTVEGMQGVETPPDPDDGNEIDVAECFAGSKVQHNVHWGGYDSNHQDAGGITLGAESPEDVDDTVMNVYGVHWSVSGGFNKFYVNGALNWTFNTIVSTRTDHEVLLTQEYWGAFMNDPPAPWLTLVDYVRIWVPG